MIIDEILAQLGVSGEQLVVLLDADTREIFSTMVGTEVASVAAETAQRHTDSVTAMVGLTGSYNGIVSVSMCQSLAMSIAGAMLGMEVDECGDDVHDALGEIANMLGGSFKHHFVHDGHEVRLSTPSVMSGDDYVVSVGAVPDTLTLGFAVACGGEFSVTVYLEPGS